MSLVDDATSTTLLRFGDEETIWAAVAVLRAWIEAYGVPRALYTDWKNVYKREQTTNERSRGEEAYTQFGRMCQKLGIEIIGAKSPQAKGRIERNHGTQQDRLVKKMRLLGVSDDVAANEYVTTTYLPKHNLKFAVVAASTVDYHRVWDRRVREDDVFASSTVGWWATTTWSSTTTKVCSSTEPHVDACRRRVRSWCARPKMGA